MVRKSHKLGTSFMDGLELRLTWTPSAKAMSAILSWSCLHMAAAAATAVAPFCSWPLPTIAAAAEEPLPPARSKFRNAVNI